VPQGKPTEKHKVKETLDVCKQKQQCWTKISSEEEEEKWLWNNNNFSFYFDFGI